MTLKESYQNKLDTYCYGGFSEPGEWPGYTLDELLDEEPESRDFVIDEKVKLLKDSFCELYKIPEDDLKFFFKELSSLHKQR